MIRGRPLERLASAALYGSSAARIAMRRRGAPVEAATERPVFVVGAPRSGTTFVATSIGAQTGFVDLGEVKPLKAALPRLADAPEEAAARQLRQMLERIRQLGLVRHLRAVEQTPETCFVLSALVRAYPQARVVHMLRDGRDVVCSLLERGWLRAGDARRDDARAPYGEHARFWVEPDRAAEFAAASEATRAAWAWRRYVSAARSAPGETVELRYESLVAQPAEAARRLADHLDVDAEPLGGALTDAHERSVGRWQRELTTAQVADVEREAGALLQELDYTS